MKGKALLKFVSKNAPTIFLIVTCVGVVSTAIAAGDAAITAEAVLQDERERREKESENGIIDPISKKEKFLLTYKYFIPVILIGGVTIGSSISGHSTHLKRNAALASMYSLSEAALREYQTKVIQTFGEKKERAVRDELSKDALAKHPYSKTQTIIIGSGDILCFDKYSGRYFKSSMEKLKHIENVANAFLNHEDFMSLNELYSMMGLDEIKLGNNIGWQIMDGLMEFHFTSDLTDTGEPCLVVDYFLGPEYSDSPHE